MCILKVPAGNISNNHPFRSFVEDRSWSATTAYESAQIMREWNSCSDRIELVRSSKKIQLFAATAKHKHNLMLNGINEEHVTSAPCLLGSISKGRRRRKNVPKEDQLRRLPRQSLGGCSSCLRDSRSQILADASDAL